MFGWFKKKIEPVAELPDVSECLTSSLVTNIVDLAHVFGDNVHCKPLVHDDKFAEYCEVFNKLYDEDDAPFIVQSFFEFDLEYCEGYTPVERNAYYFGFALGIQAGSKMMHARIKRNFEKGKNWRPASPTMIKA